MIRQRYRYARRVPDLRPVILSGGSGTRLWPLSTPELPKQFVPLFDGRTLFGMTMGRMEGLDGLQPALVVTGAAHEAHVAAEVSTAPIETAATLVEPSGRNTAPAVIAAALVARPTDVLVILPSDHLIADIPAFHEAVQHAADLASEGGVVTFGVKPTRRETGYGYIEVGAPVGKGYRVDRFKEKPDETEAQALVADGRHLWNSGMFVVRADQALAEAEKLNPSILEGVAASLPEVRQGVVGLGPRFESVESISFDHAIMEKTDLAMVVPVDIGWNDVGSFTSLLEASPRDELGNHVAGEVVVESVHGSYLKSTSRRLVVGGVDDVIVVETPEAVLVLSLDRAQQVKELQQRFAGE